jgi:hypothetical protein
MKNYSAESARSRPVSLCLLFFFFTLLWRGIKIGSCLLFAFIFGFQSANTFLRNETAWQMQKVLHVSQLLGQALLLES